MVHVFFQHPFLCFFKTNSVFSDLTIAHFIHYIGNQCFLLFNQMEHVLQVLHYTLNNWKNSVFSCEFRHLFPPLHALIRHFSHSLIKFCSIQQKVRGDSVFISIICGYFWSQWNPFYQDIFQITRCFNFQFCKICFITPFCVIYSFLTIRQCCR